MNVTEKIQLAQANMNRLQELLNCNERGLVTWYPAVDRVTEDTVKSLKNMINWRDDECTALAEIRNVERR